MRGSISIYSHSLSLSLISKPTTAALYKAVIQLELGPCSLHTHADYFLNIRTNHNIKYEFKEPNITECLNLADIVEPFNVAIDEIVKLLQLKRAKNRLTQ